MLMVYSNSSVRIRHFSETPSGDGGEAIQNQGRTDLSASLAIISEKIRSGLMPPL
jgi:hypothetical protein